MALLCAMRYISHPWYLPDNEESGGRRRLKTRMAKVSFKCAAQRSTVDCRKQEIMDVGILRNIKIGEELLVDYCMKCAFQLPSITSHYK